MAKRGGRPRKQGVERHPGGDIVRENEPMTATPEHMRRRTEAMARVILFNPLPLASTLVNDPDAEWYIGRLRLAGLVTTKERDAAYAWREVTDEYGRMLLLPKHPVAIDMNRREPSPPPEIEDPKVVERFKRLKHKYERYWDAVAAEGTSVLRATTAALRDEEPPFHLLQKGLRALLRA